MPEPRDELVAAAATHGRSLADLSALIGRDPAFLHGFVEQGHPARLDDLDRRHLAIYLDLDERRLGAREPWRPWRD